MKKRTVKRILLVALVAFVGMSASAQQKPDPKYKAKVPPSILTPDTVQTRIGTLKFFDGLPDEETVKKVYDQLDFARGVEVFLSGIPATSVYGTCHGFDEAGIKANRVIGITEDLMNARSLFLTANQTTVYMWFCIDLKEGPVVLQTPPNVLGMLDDAYFRYVTDVGLVGADKGQGGKYLFVPPDYEGALPKTGYFISKSPTYRHFILLRSFVKGTDVAGAVKTAKAHARLYPFSVASNPPVQAFVNLTDLQLNTIHANDYHFYEELNDVVQYEPADAFEPETVGLFASIGIKKGKPFAPDARMKAILTDAVAVGNAAARAINFASRDPRTKLYPDRQWTMGWIGGSYQFADGSERMRDARTLFHYYATGITPAMAAAKPGTGSAYGYTVRDAQGRYLDGSKTYKVTLPAPIPVANFWSLTVYDSQTRSMLETDQKLAGVDSNQPALKKNADGSVTVWFAPKAPAGQENNWVQTMPGKSWHSIVRLYGPLQPWFDKSWKPGDFELVN